MNAQELIGNLEQLAKPVKRTERGWIAHYICADRCRFRRNTLLECGNRRVIVSTIGAMYDRKNETYEEITCKQLRSKLSWYIEYMQTESDMRANEMHEAIVEEFTQKLASGAKL
jgi:hypothetical protein